MTHRGAEGADIRDGDGNINLTLINGILGAGVMTAIPHELFVHVAQNEYNLSLPNAGEYAVGNIFLNPDPSIRQKQKVKIFLY